jgi:hypothetical protein
MDANGKKLIEREKKRKEAKRKLKKDRDRYSPAHEVYRCRFCNKWHIGHLSKTQRRKRRKARRNTIREVPVPKESQNEYLSENLANSSEKTICDKTGETP